MHQSLRKRVRDLGVDGARQFLMETVDRLRGEGPSIDLASALRELGELERWRSDHTAATRHYEESVALLRELGEPMKLSHTVRHLGQVLQEMGDIERAESCYQEALDLHRKHGEPISLDLANAVRYLAVAKVERDATDEASLLWHEAHDLYRALDIQTGVAEGAACLALLAFRKGDLQGSREWRKRARTAADASGDPDAIEHVRGVAREIGEAP